MFQQITNKANVSTDIRTSYCPSGEPSQRFPSRHSRSHVYRLLSLTIYPPVCCDYFAEKLPIQNVSMVLIQNMIHFNEIDTLLVLNVMSATRGAYYFYFIFVKALQRSYLSHDLLPCQFGRVTITNGCCRHYFHFQ